jgi:adenine-specific DNA-methyltransferase
MRLQYFNKKSEKEVYDSVEPIELYLQKKSSGNNILIQAENLAALKYLIEKKKLKGKIDLIYIDPPFASNNIFKISDGRANTISMSNNGVIAYKDILRGSEFIEFLRERLFLLRMLLSPTGSIYLHIDYKIGHYVKVVMDEIFGPENFRNDITRIKCNPKNFERKGYGNIKDLILFYSKSDSLIWNEPKTNYTNEDKLKLFPKKDKEGRHYTTIPLHAPGETKNGKSSMPFKGIYPPKGRHWRTDVKTLEEWNLAGIIEWSSTGNPRKKIFFDEQEGKRIQDIWEFKDPQYPVFPTEKNQDMLNTIIKTSSHENSYVLDCFCGSGTTLKAAQLNGRNWIGIDESEEAIKATIKKIKNINKDLFNNTGFQFLTEQKKKTSKQKLISICD